MLSVSNIERVNVLQIREIMLKCSSKDLKGLVKWIFLMAIRSLQCYVTDNDGMGNIQHQRLIWFWPSYQGKVYQFLFPQAKVPVYFWMLLKVWDEQDLWCCCYEMALEKRTANGSMHEYEPIQQAIKRLEKSWQESMSSIVFHMVLLF